MKAKLKTPRGAAVIMVVLIVISVLVGLNRTFYLMRKDITEEYYQYSSGIQRMLDCRVEAANGLSSLADGYKSKNSAIEPLQTRLEQDVQALLESDSPSEQFDANSLLSGSFNGLAAELESSGASISSFQSSFEEAQQAIQDSNYNRKASSYNEKLRSFPTILFRWAIFSSPLEEFR